MLFRKTACCHFFWSQRPRELFVLGFSHHVFTIKVQLKTILRSNSGTFTAMNLTFTNPQTVLYQSTPGEQNSFVWPVFMLSLYLQPSTVVGLFQRGLPSCTPGTEPFSALCARFCQTSGDSDPSYWVCVERRKPEEPVNILCIVTLSKLNNFHEE